MKLLGGSEEMIGKENNKEQEEQEEKLEEDEIRIAVMKMILKKVSGIDGIPMEAWRFGGIVVKKKD